MTKKKDRPTGVFISLELREVISRLRDKEPELTETLDRVAETADLEDHDTAETEGDSDAEEAD